MQMNQENAARLLTPLTVYAFAVDDVKLYLDTHPDSCEALSYYQRMRDAARKAREEYEANVGPLTANAVDTADGWSAWIEDPWPWEGGNC